jgi:sec-independent protein translocase protein TatB
MFDMAWSELAFVAVLALVVVGPKDLPKLIRGAGRLTARVQRFYRQSMTTVRRLENELEVARVDPEPPYRKLLPEHVRQTMAAEADIAPPATAEATPPGNSA